MRRLADEGFESLYYSSHAPFLFAVPNAGGLEQLKKILIDAGIPGHRLQYPQ
jgi:hypothetical protein